MILLFLLHKMSLALANKKAPKGAFFYNSSRAFISGVFCVIRWRAAALFITASARLHAGTRWSAGALESTTHSAAEHGNG